MKKTDIFIFTYSGDRALLDVTVPQLKSVIDENCQIVVADQGDARAFQSEDEALALGADRYTVTEWDRNGNIRGLACITGMLDTYATAREEAEFVMQWDSDCLMFSIDSLHAGSEATLIGQKIGFGDPGGGTLYRYVSGAGMMIAKSLLPRMRELVRDPGIMDRISKGYGFSDHVITVLAEIAGARKDAYPYIEAGTVDGHHRRIANYKFDGDGNVPEWEHSAGIHFDKDNAPGKTEAARTKAVLAAMRLTIEQHTPILEGK